VHNAWLKTIEDGIHTADIFTPGLSARLVGTRAFADAVIDRLGRTPARLTPASYEATVTGALTTLDRVRPRATKQMVGVDVFLDWDDDLRDPASLAGRLRPLAVDGLNLTMISNRGTKVWPDGIPETFCTDHWRCRFEAPAGRSIGHGQVTSLLDRIAGAGLDFIKTESLCTFDGVPAYSRGQGQ
jgi:isocitrate dehydrogenase